ncbi:hypothetical protein ICN28_06170 [Polynucleobacter sp. 30F-ANTBAC]|uniref:hypothetical protein n=1 Tax=Polynucleobacter sp. 30F-ANTBAC TaxID=2689095 RepID=UPI001C0C311E|nr:hypothetical protein [Polynucleobacter sp. 30F-ANTBAC]MBU3600098.1 hypothetical protein [Polynucleobacter sp. 30F-ANTBAC]
MINESTEYQRRYGSEIESKARVTPIKHYDRIIDFIVSNNEWAKFTITTTFTNLEVVNVTDGIRGATIDEYLHKVLWKIKKNLSSSRNQWDKLIPYECLYEYEYDVGSFFKPIPQSNSPHHIHGIVPIPNFLVPKIFNLSDGSITKRLAKDLSSIRTVSSFFIEPLRVDEAWKWVNYLKKGKTPKVFRNEWDY